MIIWCASYPKSGNTWIRAIITSLLYSKNGMFNFKMLSNISQFPTRSHFNKFTENFSDLKKVSEYWIQAQREINNDGKLKFFKTHNGNYNFLGNDFTNKKNTCAVIYIVRDPRNVVTSLSNHYQLSLEESLNFLLDEKRFLFNLNNPNDKSEENIITLLGSWKNHYNSWKISSNSIIIRYEDLLSNPELQINKLSSFIKKFSNFEVNSEKINNIIKTTSFEELKKKEEIDGFEEASTSNTKFFNLGPKNKWKNMLNEKLIKIIEEKFCKEMEELRYI